MSVEKNCKWHFLQEGPSDIGPNDPIVDKFKGRPYYSIVREAIQNTLDVQLDKDNPVTIKFNWFELDRKQFPNLFQIEKHIQAAKEYYSTNRNAEQLFGNMLQYLNGFEEGLKKFKISCLKLSESNTSGMDYREGVSDTPFQGFLRSQGNSIKEDTGAGGSFGYGKGAYFALSPIKTVIVSTKTKDSKYFMEGCTRLSTHKDDNGNKISSIGYYDNNEGKPITDDNLIPEVFRRTEFGTDFNIIGLWEKENRKEIMIKTILNNFWLAIWDKKLIVEIDDVVIERENLERIIDDFFLEETEYGSAGDIENWNPKPYFKAVKFAGSNEQFKVFPDTLDTLGDVKLYVYLNKGLPNRTSFFRALKMIVYKGRRRNIINGYAAVFLCDSKKGNDILRLMENPAHNEWSKVNYPKEKGEISVIAQNAESEINSFVRETLKNLSKSRVGESTSVSGLEDYLYSTEELLEKYEEQQMQGNSPSNTDGQQTDEINDEETGLQTTEIENPSVKIELNRTKTQEIKEDEVTVEPDEDGEDKVTTGGENESGGGDKQGQGDSGADSGTDNGGDEGSKLFLDVVLRVVAQREDEKLYHSLIINSPRDVENAEIELMVGADNEHDDEISLVSTDKGNIDDNVLNRVQLAKGRNIVKVGFSDNVKHSIKVKAYEIQ